MRVEVSTTDLVKKNYGLLAGAMSYVLWGILPIYWKIIKEVPAYEILAHRIVWSFVFVALIITVRGEWEKIISIIKNKKLVAYIALCSICISVNWFVYIWSVTSGHIVDASLGYYINPLMSILFGMLILKEKLNRHQYMALAIALIGVTLMVVLYGSIPWISLALAVSFGLYGLGKKMVAAESITGLAVETLIMVPPALVFLIFRHSQGYGAFGSSAVVTVLLALSGIITATPLLLFAEGTRNVKLSTMGFLQYLSPTISLIIGIFVYKESFSHADIVSFGFIWLALIIYSSSLLRKVPVT